MARGGISSVNSEKFSNRFTSALSSAFLEWLLLFMLLIDAIISYIITKFAHKCKLQIPCLLCSRLDHVFGKEKLKFYWDLVCGDHKLEISSLVYCHAHNKLVDVHGTCESCLFSFATINKSNAETYRLLVGKLGEDFGYGLEKDRSLENHKLGHSTVRHCSCCNDPWMPKGHIKTLIQTQSAVSQAAEFDLPLPVSVEHGQDDQSRSDNVSISVKVTHQRKNGPDPLSHVAYTGLTITSDSESEVSNDAGNEEDALIIETDHLQRDIVDQHEQPESRTITLSDDFASEKLMDPVSEPKPSIFISQAQSDIIKPLGSKSVESTDSSEHGLEELNWKQAISKTEPFAFSELIFLDEVPLSSNGGEASIDVSTEMNLNCLDKVPSMSNAGEIPIQGSEDSKLISVDYVSSSSLGNETPVEVSKSKPIIIDDVSPSNVVASSVEESKESSVTRTLEVEKKSLTKCEEICKSTEQPLPIPESPIEKNLVASYSSMRSPNSLELSDAYKLAVGSKGRQLSGLLVEQWIGKDSSRLSEDLKGLLSQLSAARGIEQSMNDVSPRIGASPSISIKSDEIKASDSPTFEGLQILQKRISLERNESGLSIDGSIVSEIEGESVVDRLKRQVEHDKKLLSALYKELEEERNASAVAANQAMAMITRLQEEKAKLHMEALQNLRMMEEQAEYDMEALQKTNDLLTGKEKEIQDLQAELEFYRMKFPNDLMLGDTVKSAHDLKARQGTVDHSEANGIEERASVLIEPVDEKVNICSTVEETDQSCRDTNKDTMKNPLSGYEK
ncbi:myosin-binding protein 1-like [Durio zibethinus]|uniref:Myosin-binding protein 1-like n=1 Tax=Durio zibethinus TaxID=66656 RepID=A0A6P5YWM5_DURZI|nr:myosin-binding protein 1-like [Durio zibethinus]